MYQIHLISFLLVRSVILGHCTKSLVFSSKYPNWQKSVKVTRWYLMWPFSIFVFLKYKSILLELGWIYWWSTNSNWLTVATQGRKINVSIANQPWYSKFHFKASRLHDVEYCVVKINLWLNYCQTVVDLQFASLFSASPDTYRPVWLVQNTGIGVFDADEVIGQI